MTLTGHHPRLIRRDNSDRVMPTTRPVDPWMILTDVQKFVSRSAMMPAANYNAEVKVYKERAPFSLIP